MPTRSTPTRSYGTGSIVERKKGVWQVRVSYGVDPDSKRQVRRAVTVHGGRRDAQRRLSEMLAMKHTHHHPAHASPHLKVGEWMREYLDTKSVAPQTRRTHQQFWKLYASDELRATALRNLSLAFVRAELTRLSETVSTRTGQPLSARTVGIFHAVLRAGLETAVDDGLIPKNPAARLKRGKAERSSTRARAMPPEHIAAFLAVADADRLAAMWRLALDGGMRPGEMLGLRWEDVDVSAEAVTVRHSLTRLGEGQGDMADRYILGPNKTGRVRTVDLFPETIAALGAHWQRQQAEQKEHGHRYQDYGLVFCDLIGRPLNECAVYKRFTNLLGRAGVPPYRMYDLRHTSVTHDLIGGTDARTVAERVGHADPAMTLRVYAHTSKSAQQASRDRRADVLAGRAARGVG